MNRWLKKRDFKYILKCSINYFNRKTKLLIHFPLHFNCVLIHFQVSSDSLGSLLDISFSKRESMESKRYHEPRTRKSKVVQSIKKRWSQYSRPVTT